MLIFAMVDIQFVSANRGEPLVISPIDIFIIIAAISMGGIAVFLIPVLIQLRQTLKQTDALIDSLQKEITPLSSTLTDAANEIKELSAAVNEKLDQTDVFLDSLEKSGDIILHTSKVLRESTAPIITEVGALSAGLKAFMYFFTRPQRSR